MFGTSHMATLFHLWRDLFWRVHKILVRDRHNILFVPSGITLSVRGEYGSISLFLVVRFGSSMSRSVADDLLITRDIEYANNDIVSPLFARR
jgi:hypothetical protein